jgi:hypothetical protein
MNTRAFLINTYLDWRNNYLTVATFADHKEITEEQAKALIELARNTFNSNNPHQ